MNSSKRAVIDDNLNQCHVHNINLELIKTNIKLFKILKHVTVKYAFKKNLVLNINKYRKQIERERFCRDTNINI